MRYIKTYENFKPIKINSAKPFKVKKNIDKSIQFLQKGISSLRRRIDKPVRKRDVNKSAKLNKDKNEKIQKLKQLQIQKIKQNNYLRNNPVKENLETTVDLLTLLSSPDFKAKDILDHIGLEKDEYKFDRDYNFITNQYDPSFHDNGMTIFMHLSTLENLMGLDKGVLNYFLQFTVYNDYEHYVDDEELNYLDRYLSDEIIDKIKKLSKLFKTGIKIEEDKWGIMYAIPNLFEELGLKDDLTDFKYEIANEQERALSKSCITQIKTLPFDLSYHYSDDFDAELKFDYETLIEYMKKHNIKVKTISELFENIYEADEFTYENEWERINDYIGDYNDLNNAVEKIIDEYLKWPDEIFPKLILNNNLKLFKKNKEKADFSYYYNTWIKYNKFNGNLFQMAKLINSQKILEWFRTKEFEQFIETKSNDEIDAYHQFIFEGDVERYNL